MVVKCPNGQHLLLCFISDSYLATSRVEIDLYVEAAALDDAKTAQLLAQMGTNADEGDVAGGTQLAGTMIAALNTKDAATDAEPVQASPVAVVGGDGGQRSQSRDH